MSAGNSLFMETELGKQLAVLSEICTVLEKDSGLTACLEKPASAGHAVTVYLLPWCLGTALMDGLL